MLYPLAYTPCYLPGELYSSLIRVEFGDALYPLAYATLFANIMNLRELLLLFLLPSDNVRHDLQHGSLINFPERRKPREQKDYY